MMLLLLLLLLMLLLLLLLLLLMWWSVAEKVLGGHQLEPVGVPGLTLALGEQRRACDINTCICIYPHT